MKTKKNEIAVYSAVINGELEIDSQGQVWRVAARRGKRHGGSHLVPCKRRRAEHWVPAGYAQVRVMVNGKRHHALAHRLIWHHHRGEIPDGLNINHKNGDKGDNRLANLELVTPSENAKHAANVLKVGRCANQSGEWNHSVKVTDVQVAEIRQRRFAGEPLISIAKDYGVTFQTISKIALHQRR